LDRSFNIWMIIGAMLTGLSVSNSMAVERAPNVVLVIASQFGWQQLPAHGGDQSIETPAFDRLMAEGMELSRFYACPLGAPTRASLLTGRYHYRTGVAGDEYGENVMHGYEITLAEVMRDNGYATASFGEWKNGRNWPSNAAGQGFETVAEDEAITAALNFVSEKRDRAFFCLLSLGKEGLKETDEILGRLLDGLDDANAAPNTIVVFTADCGSGRNNRAGGKSEASKTPQFFGEAGSVHEAGVRVPFLVRWPGVIPAGADSREISASIDLLPTLVELCQATFIETLSLDGISLAELLRTGGKPRRWPNRILFTSATPPGYGVKRAGVAVRTGRWLAVREAESSRAESGDEPDGWELYDLLADPYQRYNVADEYWYLAGHLSADFMFWMKYTTENGLGAIPSEIGHSEWPRVVLHVDDLPFEVAESKALRWPVEVVEAGDYRVNIDWQEGASRAEVDVSMSCMGIEVRRTLGKGDVTLGSVNLPRGVGELELKIDSADSLRAVVIEASGPSRLN